ncbi:MAG: DUF4923 family protein [Bacteroidaceae bacterium]|jgi:hypothetical protein|nr:DUF4923 family protein [Bacteroidaceae bacterium]MBQ8938454.1 DUF4923 family protein [Bacteroidaceae bacterium]MBQ9190773.1 DUF4923 family protein [Bacteroidaceae bacterium]MBQ9192045.1 DUF4923 family protein [Bacteroidaceae bacterium]
MKKNIITAAILAASLTLSSCGTTGANALGSILGGAAGTTTGTTDTGSVLGSAGATILNSLLGSILSSSLTEQSIVGSWTYQQPEVRFESENLLAKAGGEVAASSIEQKLNTYLSKVGITKGATTYTFKEDKTFAISTGSKTISTGTYTFDANSKTLTLQGSLGLLNQTCTVGMDGTNLCLLYDADKLLTAVNAVGGVLGKANSTLGSITKLLGNSYQGMKLGFQLAK